MTSAVERDHSLDRRPIWVSLGVKYKKTQFVKQDYDKCGDKAVRTLLFELEDLANVKYDLAKLADDLEAGGQKEPARLLRKEIEQGGRVW